MKDLKSQLMAQFGAPTPEPADAAPDPLPAALAVDAHLDTDWLRRLRFFRTLAGGPSIPEQPNLAAARQLTDRVAKVLKKGGRGREAKDLVALRDDWLAVRERQAWAAIKARFKEHGLSDKAYRALKQGGSDPVAVLTRLAKADPADLKSMGAARLREALES